MTKKTTLTKRLHIYYSGSVQGIGFRYTARRIAVSLDLTGWAGNLRDGRVEIVAEGNESDIASFLEKINDEFGGYIRDVDIDWSAATGEFSGFRINFL